MRGKREWGKKGEKRKRNTFKRNLKIRFLNVQKTIIIMYLPGPPAWITRAQSKWAVHVLRVADLRL